MQNIFNLCVECLLCLGALTGLTYVEVNVWIFCIIWPLLTVGLIIISILEAVMLLKQKQRRKNELSL